MQKSSQNLSREDALRDILRRRLAIRKFRDLAAITERFARDAGYADEAAILEDPT